MILTVITKNEEQMRSHNKVKYMAKKLKISRSQRKIQNVQKHYDELLFQYKV